MTMFEVGPFFRDAFMSIILSSRTPIEDEQIDERAGQGFVRC